MSLQTLNFLMQHRVFFNKQSYFQAIGNHEFDNGLGPLQDFINNVTADGGFDVLSSNINNSMEVGLTGYKPYVVKEVGGKKIGIVGYTTVDTPVLTSVGRFLRCIHC